MVFDNASIQTMIMSFKKDSKIDDYTFDYRKLQNVKPSIEDALNMLSKIDVEQTLLLNPSVIRENFKDNLLTFSTDKNLDLLNKIKEKQNFYLREKADKERNLKAEVGSGIDVLQDFVNKSNAQKLNGAFNVGDGVFVLSNAEFQKENFNAKEKEIIKPYFTTEQLSKYFGNDVNTHWIIYTKSDVNKVDKKTEKRPIDDFPNIQEHLDKFQSIITSDNAPYGLHRTREQHLFEGEKIFALRKCPKEPRFTYTDFDCFVSRAFLVIQSNRIDLKYLTGLLNSKLIAFWLKNKGKMQGNNYQIDKEPILEIPIFEPETESQLPLIQLVEQILLLKSTDKTLDTSDLERQIDAAVYALYDLTDAEIAIIEGKDK